MSLTQADFKSSTWEKLEALLEERLATHRAKNDGDLNSDETARLRGRIAELKFLLALAKQPGPAPEVEAGL